MANSRGYPRCASLLDNENTLVFLRQFYDKPNKGMTSYVGLCTLIKTVWINKVRKREAKSGYKILSLEIPTMKPEGKGKARVRQNQMKRR